MGASFPGTSGGGRAFNWGGGGGVDTAPLASPPPPSLKKDSIDGPPKILPRLNPGGPGGDPDPKFGKN